MKSLRRTLAILLALVMLLSACSPANSNAPATEADSSAGTGHDCNLVFQMSHVALSLHRIRQVRGPLVHSPAGLDSQLPRCEQNQILELASESDTCQPGPSSPEQELGSSRISLAFERPSCLESCSRM